jgi:hypothetical protein
LFLLVVRMGKVKTPMVPLVTNSNWLDRVLFIFKVFLGVMTSEVVDWSRSVSRLGKPSWKSEIGPCV